MKKLIFKLFLVSIIININANDKDMINKAISLNNNSKEEIALYLKAIETNPKNDIAYYNLGCIYFDNKDYKNAIIYFQKSLSIKKDPDYYYNLALSFYYLKDDVEAIKALKELLKIKPKDYEAGYFLSYIYSLTDNINAKNQARFILKSILTSREIQLYEVDFIEKVKKLYKDLGGE
ncbi:MAG TPA: tetratricopeptide repeat protein [Spirochaetota bacterium]|nr:tetratricopeptide repeat protein [Spirochaetota bacterium]HOM38453.1 tetratricopeptide repeat protein [Spirochaetota bacterium]HPQ48993.1 tetratricopeptide repeat protein [Spirochaetota bacterium]